MIASLAVLLFAGCKEVPVGNDNAGEPGITCIRYIQDAEKGTEIDGEYFFVFYSDGTVETGVLGETDIRGTWTGDLSKIGSAIDCSYIWMRYIDRHYNSPSEIGPWEKMSETFAVQIEVNEGYLSTQLNPGRVLILVPVSE